MPNLPAELYREIGENLDHLKDRPTFLSLALTDRAWHYESQRFMYRGVVDEDWLGDYRKALKRHTLFLERIISSPALGLYVKIYCQRKLAVDPDMGEWEIKPPAHFKLEPFVNLWHLTHKALPLMPNVKHLLFVTYARSGLGASRTLFSECKFQLQTLSWELGRSEDLQLNFIPFLRTQASLSHLEVSNWKTYPEDSDLSWLPGKVCPDLISASCTKESIEQVMQNRHIKALRLDGFHYHDNNHSLSSDTIAALGRLEYLSVWDFEPFRAFVGPVDLSVRVLELLSWDRKAIKTLPRLPELRILCLLESEYDNYDPMRRRRVAEQCFRKCPKLEYILLQDDLNLTPRPCNYTKFTVRRATDPLNRRKSVLEIVDEKICMERPLGTVWWTVYPQ